jgi:hypothetical protein
MALSPTRATATQRASWLPARIPPAARSCDDERDPAPRTQIAEHVVRVGDEHVRVGDRGDAVDEVEEAKYQQQDGREDNQPVAFACCVAPAPAGGGCGC